MTPPQKQPVIRRGQRVPYFRGTQREIDQRRGYVGRLLARGMPKMAIHDVIRCMFNRQWRTVDRDIAFITSLQTHDSCAYARGTSSNLNSEFYKNLAEMYAGSQSP
jgi:hypothetical protein